MPVDPVEIADELHVDATAVGRLQWFVLVADIFVSLQLGKILLIADDVPEKAQLPDLLP
jgi:hypothetical protein